jgi:N-acetylmuramoyl-L-alanine amidase
MFNSLSVVCRVLQRGSQACGGRGRSHPRWSTLFGPSLLLVLSVYGLLISYGEAANEKATQAYSNTCNRAAFRVVVDVGHTAEAPGALSARGVPEYEFNLRLARVLEERLLEAGFNSAVLLVTKGQGKSGLVERVARANALKADLFISVHHDSVPQFLKEEWEYEGRPNSFSDRFAGHSIFVSAKNRRQTASVTFARLLGRELKAGGLQYTPHYTQGLMGPWQRKLVDAEAGVYRYDQLVVLRTTHMPAVLLEAGSIVNRNEELLLASPERQRLIAASLVKAVEGFCASAHRRRTIMSASRTLRR